MRLALPHQDTNIHACMSQIGAIACILPQRFPITESCLSGKDNAANAMHAIARIKYTRDTFYNFLYNSFYNSVSFS